MSSVSIQDQSFLSKLLPSTWESQTLGSTSPSNGGDPAQAALILLIAGKTKAIFTSVSKMESHFVEATFLG
jgi:hypothetical protein